MQALRIMLCRIDDMPDGDSRGFDPFDNGQDTVMVVRQGQRLYGYRDSCPHYGETPMAWRRHAYLDAERKHIVCAAHGALFRIADGVCVRGPCLGQRLTQVQLAVEHGQIHLAQPNTL